jgi:hypothetical protein
MTAKDAVFGIAYLDAWHGAKEGLVLRVRHRTRQLELAPVRRSAVEGWRTILESKHTGRTLPTGRM